MAGPVLLRGGVVIDGTGGPRYVADVRVRDGRISEIGVNLTACGESEIDVAGRIVAPGFIDVHTHDDQMVLASPKMLPKISQGVTTVVVGNCGISLAPLVHDNVPPPLNLLGGTDKHVFPTMGSYARAVDDARPAVNVVALVGHSTLRVATMADPYRPATTAEQARMVALISEAMDAGAAGLSTGVFYAPGAAADVGRDLVAAAPRLHAAASADDAPAACAPRPAGSSSATRGSNPCRSSTPTPSRCHSPTPRRTGS